MEGVGSVSGSFRAIRLQRVQAAGDAARADDDRGGRTRPQSRQTQRAPRGHVPVLEPRTAVAASLIAPIQVRGLKADEGSKARWRRAYAAAGCDEDLSPILTAVA